jgi:hypothetical protein
MDTAEAVAVAGACMGRTAEAALGFRCHSPCPCVRCDSDVVFGNGRCRIEVCIDNGVQGEKVVHTVSQTLRY